MIRIIYTKMTMRFTFNTIRYNQNAKKKKEYQIMFVYVNFFMEYVLYLVTCILTVARQTFFPKVVSNRLEKK